ncbi:MAG: RNA methyltransferase, partial [Thermodesulfovibrionales bacterium]
PGNIGASARAIKNAGFFNLSLVNPFRGVPFDEKNIRGILENSEARWFAGGAKDILKNVEIHSNLHDSISDKALVVGTTRRTGKRRGVILSVEEGIKRILDVASHNKVAILFGREDKGLFNEEIRECGFLITIEASRKAPSLNLAQAVLIIAYELNKMGMERYGSVDSIGIPDLKLVSHSDIEGLLDRLKIALKGLGYIPKGDRDLEKKIMDNMGFLLKRAGLTEWELNMLHGICTKIIEKSQSMVE